MRFGVPLGPPAEDGRARRLFTAELQGPVAGLCGQPLANQLAVISASG